MSSGDTQVDPVDDVAALTVQEFVDTLGSKTPTPGGGAVAGVAAALASAVSQMVVSFSAGRKSLAEHAELHAEAQRTLDELSAAALAAAADDARAFGTLNDLWKLPEDNERRVREWDDAVLGAIEPPMKVLSASLGVLHLLVRLHGTTNRMLDSDLAIGAILAEAAARAAAWNVRINLPHLTDRNRATGIAGEVSQMLDRAAAMAQVVEASAGQ